MTEVVAVEGPLEPARLQAVGDLYAKADPKFARPDVVRHLFVDSPAGAALHGLAIDGERVVGHSCVVPLRTRLGAGELRSGKLEALWIEPAYRGRRPDGGTLIRELYDRLYAFADEQGFALVHALATERIGGVIRFHPLGEVGEPSLVATLSAPRALAAAQRLLRAPVRTSVSSLRAPEDADVDLVSAQPPPEGRWTVLGADAWDWYRASPLLRVLELPQARALVQLPGVAGQPLRVIGWRGEKALALVAAAARVAAEHAAGSIRFQPWAAPPGDGELRRACRLLGFVPRRDLTSLWVRTADPALQHADAVVPSPLLYLAF